MKNYFQILIFSLLAITVSCTQNYNQTKQLVIRKSYTPFEGWTNNDSLELIVNSSATTIEYIIRKQADSIDIEHFIALENDITKMFYRNDTCKLIASKQYKSDNKTLTIRKYLFDIEEDNDDECSIFVLENFGIICIKSEAWPYADVFYNSENAYVFDELKKDTSDFFWDYMPIF